MAENDCNKAGALAFLAGMLFTAIACGIISFLLMLWGG